MANATAVYARNVHGTDPQHLVEKIVRTKIYDSTYWKEHCFGLSAETLVDKAVQLDHVGGTHGGTRAPTPFLCLLLKMLQIQPDREIVLEFILNEDYKYVRVLGAMYWRMVARAHEIYSYLEPLYVDYRKARRRLTDGTYTLTHVDEVIDELLTQEACFDITLPFLMPRHTLEATSKLPPRVSALEQLAMQEVAEEGANGVPGANGAGSAASAASANSAASAGVGKTSDGDRDVEMTERRGDERRDRSCSSDHRGSSRHRGRSRSRSRSSRRSSYHRSSRRSHSRSPRRSSRCRSPRRSSRRSRSPRRSSHRDRYDRHDRHDR